MHRQNLVRSRRRRRWFAAVLAVMLIALTLGLMNVVLRLVHVGPMASKPVAIDVQRDEGKTSNGPADARLKVTQPDKILGYKHLPGRFRVKLGDGYTFTMTHRQDTLRITQPASSYKTVELRPPLWIFGGSFTHGWSVNDEATFPWRVQEALRGFDVVNFGVSGYGQIQAILQFGQAIRSRHLPKVVVVTYAHFHDQRNTFSRAYRKHTVARMAADKRGTPFPFARISPDGRVKIDWRPAEFRGLMLLQWFAPANYADQLLDRVDERLIRIHDVSKALILEFDRRCREQGIELVVAGITQEPATWDVLAFCVRHQIRQVDISFDYDNPRYMNSPHDPSHPSPAGQRIFALRLVAYLKQHVLAAAPDKTAELKGLGNGESDLPASRAIGSQPGVPSSISSRVSAFFGGGFPDPAPSR